MNDPEGTELLSASVVVLCKDERDVDRTLGALEAQRTRRNVQVLVVDASSGRLSDIAAAHPGVVWVDYVPRPGSTKRVTIPEQRNDGIAATNGDVVVFLDAGCVPEPDWIDRLLEPLDAGREHVVVGGRRNPRDGRYTVATTADHYVEDAPTLNFAVRRTVFDRIGPLDESFSYGSDIDLCWRMGEAGIRLLMVPGAQVSVDWGGGRRQVRRAWQYGIARARLYHKHPQRLRGLARRDPILVVYPLFLLGLPVVLLAPWQPWVLAYPALLLVPAWRARNDRPVMTLVDHLVFGAGALAHVVGAR